MIENTIKHGLKENASQFWILVLINAFVGGYGSDAAKETADINIHTQLSKITITINMENTIKKFGYPLPTRSIFVQSLF